MIGGKILKIYTIGFTKKSAQTFFETLSENNVETLIDVRLNNKSQLAGFTKGKDLPYLLKKINNISYRHMPNLAPTKNLLKSYKENEINWEIYETEYLSILNDRDILNEFEHSILNNSCLLCSEPKPDQCHRRLLAEYFARNLENINIIHL